MGSNEPLEPYYEGPVMLSKAKRSYKWEPEFDQEKIGKIQFSVKDTNVQEQNLFISNDENSANSGLYCVLQSE